jgi:S-layer homology domain.
VNFDLPDARPIVIKDIVDSNHLFNQIQTVAGLGIMKLDSNNRFLPDSPVSGKEVFQIISRAKERSINGR